MNGHYEIIARALFGLSAICAIIFFYLMQRNGSMALSWSMVICVGGPIAAGLIVRWVGRKGSKR